MKPLWTYLILIILLSACKDEMELPREPLRRTVVVYMMAENSLSSLAQADLAEMRAALGQIPEDCELVVYLDNSRTDVRPQIISFTPSGGEQVMLHYGTDPVSTDSLTMLNALRYIIRERPARSYGLVLWSHATGFAPAPRRTIGIDNGRNTYSDTGLEMEITTLRGVLEQVGVQWEYIFSDACFMQGVEVAYELRRLTRWLVASPAEIPGAGAPYDVLMPHLFLDEDAAQAIAQGYFDAYKSTSGLLISAVRTDRLDALLTATRPLLPAGLEGLPTDSIQAYCAYSPLTGWKPEYYDMASAMNRWLSPEDYVLWFQVLKAAVPLRLASASWLTSYPSVYASTLHDSKHYAGLSFYFPLPGRAEHTAAWRRFEWSKGMGA